MKFIRYSRFKGFDVSGLSLGDLMELMQDSMLSSGYDEDYYWTRQRQDPDRSLDALRQALLRALLEMGELAERDVEEMLAENKGQFKGSQLEELLNQLVERLVEEGYLKLSEEPAEAERRGRRGQGRGEVGEPLPRPVVVLIVTRRQQRVLQQPHEVAQRQPRHVEPLEPRIAYELHRWADYNRELGAGQSRASQIFVDTPRGRGITSGCFATAATAARRFSFKTTVFTRSKLRFSHSP